MPGIKKIIFIPLFIALIVALLLFYKPILDKYLDVFFTQYAGLYEFGTLAGLIIFSSLAYCLFLTFTQNLKYTSGLALAASVTPFLFLKTELAMVIGAGFFIGLFLTHFILQTNLKTYVNFQPVSLLSGRVKTLNSFLLLALTFGFFLNTNSIIKREGFKMPDQVIDWAVNLSLNQAGIPVKGEKYLAQALTPEQLELLKQNPQVLEQFGLKSSDVDQFVQTDQKQNQSPNRNAVKIVPAVSNNLNLKDIVKAQISNSLDEITKPYLFAIPFILSLLFYSIASFYLWFFSLFLNPLILLLFGIFEKTGFLKFEKEMREIKKIVV